MERKDEIKNAYKNLGKMHNYYDGMMTGTTLIGRFVDKTVWQMDKNDIVEYQSRSLENIPKDFKGNLLEVPVGTGVFSLPVWKTLPDARITCLDYSEKMLEGARNRAEELDIRNVTFMQGDVGKLPFEDRSFDIVVSLNGFHAFPDKEAAYSETYRVLKDDGLFMGCFYVKDANSHTDMIIRDLYVKKGFFTPPFETVETLKKRLEENYTDVQVSNVQSIACFCARKKK
ncbi:MAG: class I SAM-dependent methyltransferase [Erysipelotrichaceae bacterium]|nr:class I SAM-dependent methyltransferase [Erysipelotrichaceae bacterium]